MRWLVTLAATGCVPSPDSGTAVGNPGDLAMRADQVPDGVHLDRAEAQVAEVDVDDCQGEEVPLEVDHSVDLLAGDALAELDPGQWCGLRVVLGEGEGPVVLEGTTDTTPFAVDLDPGDLTLAEAFQIDGNRIVIRLPLDGVFSAEQIDAMDLDTGVEVVQPDVETSAEWSLALADGAVLTDDGPTAAYGDSAQAEATCGCASTPRAPAGVTFGLVLLAVLVGRARTLARWPRTPTSTPTPHPRPRRRTS